MIRIAFYGSSLLSSYWNGAATYYRGLLSALAPLGYDITFYEPDAYERQSHRDIEPPPWARVRVYAATPAAVRDVLAEASGADIVVKASGVGVFDNELLAGVVAAGGAPGNPGGIGGATSGAHARRGAETRNGPLRVFWDVDAPATLAELAADASHPLHAALGELDLVLTYGGGDPVVRRYRGFGARECVPVYNALDPATHFPVPPDPSLRADLAFLANRMPDREARAETFFFQPAAMLPDRVFLLGGNGWDDKPASANVRRIGHVGTERHNAFNASALAVLNVARDSMASVGFSPATRVFEAAGAGACLITDAWEGLELFLTPGTEVLVARDGRDVADHVGRLTPAMAREIGAAAQDRVLREHTYDRRARQVDALFRAALAARQG